MTYKAGDKVLLDITIEDSMVLTGDTILYWSGDMYFTDKRIIPSPVNYIEGRIEYFNELYNSTIPNSYEHEMYYHLCKELNTVLSKLEGNAI